MAGPSMETPNDLMMVFSSTVTAGFDALSEPVNTVFGLLVVLVVALTGIQWALSANRDVLASGFAKVMLIGAFAWLINDWQALSETLFAGFLELGLTAGGSSLSREEFLNPGAVLQQGWEIVKALGDTPAPVDNPLDIAGNMTDALILGLAMIGILLAFAVLALQIIVTLLEFKIVTLGGFVLLPFGIWNKTAFLAERPLGYVVSSGLKVLALAIVVSGARTIFDQLQPSTNPDIYEALTILVASILLAMLAVFIPNLAAALVTGGPALGAGAALTGGLAVAGAGALLAGGAASAGALAGRAAAVSGSSRVAAGAATSARSGGGGSGAGTGGGASGSRPGGPGPQPSGPPSGSLAGAPPGRSGSYAATPSRAWAAAESTGTGQADPQAPPSNGSGPTDPAGTRAASSSRTSGPERSWPPLPASENSRPGPPTRAGQRSAAMQTFFIANSGRGLMPTSETSGALSPRVNPED